VRVSIGIDLGSSRVKLLALDETGESLGVTMASYATDSRHPGWAEQNPDRWWDALRLAMSEMLARPSLRGAKVDAIGMTGQMHGAVLLDEQATALRPAVMWSDGRADAETSEIEKIIPRDELVALGSELFDVVGTGTVEISVNQSYDLADAASAHRDLEARKTTGSTILLP